MSPELAQRPGLQQQLEYHYGLDEIAAAELSVGVTDLGAQHIESLVHDVEAQPEALQKRDDNRREIGRILSGESDKYLIIVGPCSLDNETDDYDKLLDYIEELQAENPGAVIAFRANAAKPRTSDGPTGLFNSVNPEDRQLMLDVYKEAFKRGIPILTEITNINEFNVLGPYLSAMWLGARDMTSTSLRKLFSATNLPVLVKNGLDGKAETVESAITAIGSSTEKNEGSGVDLGFMASTYLIDGLPAMVSVGNGNKNVGIIARGHELPKEAGPIQRLRAVRRHIGELCLLSEKVGCTVIIDGSHSVPPMLKIEKGDRNRFPKVLDIIFKAASQGKIPKFDRVVGLLGEIGTTEGKTDKNFDMLEEVNRKRISLHLRRFQRLRTKIQAGASS